MFTHPKHSLPNKQGAAYFIKTAVCVIVFLAAAGAFALVCRALAQNYTLVFTPGAGTTVSWFISMLAAVLSLIITAAILAVLVRPIWVALLAYFAAAAMYPLIAGGGKWMWISAGVLALFMLLYLFSIFRNLKNQIEFSVYPLANMRSMFLTVLAALIAVSFALGYNADSARRGYAIVPPDKRATVDNFVLDKARSFIEKEVGAGAEARAALKETQKRIGGIINDLEKKAQTFRKTIAIVLGVALFLLLKIVFVAVGFILLLFLHFVFFILRVTRFAREEVIKCEIKRLTLGALDIR